jgi:colanic acid/amylovoran biosynthesis glycosyltransferase
LQLNNKKIVLINSLFPVLSETFLFEQFKRLLQQSEQFEIVSNNVTPDDQVHPHMRSIQSKVNYLSRVSTGTIITSVLSMLLSHPFKLIACFWLSATRKEERFLTSMAHIVGACLIRKRYPAIAWTHAHFTYGAAAIAFWLYKLTNIPYSLTLHGADLNYDNPADLSQKLACASHIFSISQFNIDYMHAHFPETNQILTSVIPLGVDLKLNANLKQQGNASNCQPKDSSSTQVKSAFIDEEAAHLKLLNVGRLSEHKAQHLLIEACEQLKKNGRHFHCHIIGDGPKKGSLEKLITTLGLEQYVTLHGLMYHEDVLAFYRKADVFVMSSITEGMPLVIMESMQRGVPVIAPSISGIPEMLDDLKDGLLYQVGDVSELVAKLDLCFEQTELLGKISTNGKKRVANSFDLDANTHRFGKRLIDLANRSEVC